jgi:hypothetical protein
MISLCPTGILTRWKQFPSLILFIQVADKECINITFTAEYRLCIAAE